MDDATTAAEAAPPVPEAPSGEELTGTTPQTTADGSADDTPEAVTDAQPPETPETPPDAPDAPDAGRGRSAPVWVRAAALAVLLALGVSGCVLMLTWTASRTAPHHLPMAIAGPRAVAEAGKKSVEANPPGAFDVTIEADADHARQAVKDRRVYGALIVEDTQLRLLLAPASSADAAQELYRLAANLQARSQGLGLQVEEVVAAPTSDPRGTVPGLAVLALIGAAVAAGVVLHLRVRPLRDRLVAVVALAVAGGAASEVVLHPLAGALTGSVWAEGGVLALVILAASATTLGFAAVAGPPGAALAAVLLVPFGYPISGGTSAPELLPQPWGPAGQYLPPGAGVSALRGAAYFGGAGSATPITILAIWSVIGLALAAYPALAAVRSGARRITTPRPEPMPAA